METNFKFNCEMSGISGFVESLANGCFRIEYYFWGSSEPITFEGGLDEITGKIPPSYREKFISIQPAIIAKTV